MVRSMNDKECAKMLCEAIKKLANNPNNLDNMRVYLENHFTIWMKKYADEPEYLAKEFKEFAEMSI